MVYSSGISGDYHCCYESNLICACTCCILGQFLLFFHKLITYTHNNHLHCGARFLPLPNGRHKSNDIYQTSLYSLNDMCLTEFASNYTTQNSEHLDNGEETKPEHEEKQLYMKLKDGKPCFNFTDSVMTDKAARCTHKVNSCFVREQLQMLHMGENNFKCFNYKSKQTIASSREGIFTPSYELTNSKHFDYSNPLRMRAEG